MIKRMIQPMIQRAATIVCLLVPTAMLAFSAGAQDAIGTGHALDGNLDLRSGGVVPNSPAEDFQRRNLIITNNIVGGRGFRESVGYEAESAFRGGLGSNDLYAFRRDGAWSDVNFLNYGATSQRLRYGQAIGLLVIDYTRSSDGAMISTIDEAFQRPRERIDAKLQIDRVTAASSLTSVAELAVEPSTMGGFMDQEGRRRLLHASSLTGVGSTAYENMGQLIGLTSYDGARLRDDIAQGRVRDTNIGQSFESRYSNLRISDSLRAEEPRGERVGSGLLANAGAGAGDKTSADDASRGLERIRERIAQRFSQLPPGVTIDAEEPDLDALDKEMTDLRSWLKSVTVEPALPGRPADPDDPLRGAGGTPDPEATGPLNGRRDRTPTPRELLEASGFGAEPTEDEREAGDDPASAIPMPLEDFGIILRHGQRIDRLASKDMGRFNELVADGERLLREGEYFTSERRFIRALRLTPGHPLATAGLVHAQIGAGLYVAASLTLHSLFVYQPEMIDTRFAPGLVPNRPHLFTAAAVLRERLGDGPNRSSDGFLLAYIGRLLDDRLFVEEGLDVMADATPDDPLVPLLREVWLRADDVKDGSNPETPGPGK